MCVWGLWFMVYGFYGLWFYVSLFLYVFMCVGVMLADLMSSSEIFRISFAMHLGEGQDHLADELALGHWQLEKRFKNIPVFITNTAVPAGAALLGFVPCFTATTELLHRHAQPLGQRFHLFEVGHGFAL